MITRPCRECTGEENHIKTHGSKGISFKYYHNFVLVVIIKLTCGFIHLLMDLFPQSALINVCQMHELPCVFNSDSR